METLPAAEAVEAALSLTPISLGLADDFTPQEVDARPGGASARSGPRGPLSAQPRSRTPFWASAPVLAPVLAARAPEAAPAEHRAAPRRAVQRPRAQAPRVPVAPRTVLAGVGAPPAGGGSGFGAFPIILLALIAAYALVPPAGLRRLRRIRVRAPSGVDGTRRDRPG
jgi:hypothetical protein